MFVRCKNSIGLRAQRLREPRQTRDADPIRPREHRCEGRFGDPQRLGEARLRDLPLRCQRQEAGREDGAARGPGAAVPGRMLLAVHSGNGSVET